MIERAKVGNLAVLTGDVHSSWAYDLPRDPFAGYDKATGKGSLGVEFAGTSVSSPSNLGAGPDGEKQLADHARGAAAPALRRRPLPRLLRGRPHARAAAGRLLRRGHHPRPHAPRSGSRRASSPRPAATTSCEAATPAASQARIRPRSRPSAAPSRTRSASRPVQPSGSICDIIRGICSRTDTSDPNYYHKVVDCQWACPAHTNVPEYIRMIANGQFDDAYILNRESNVFPGILGRTCDRPCEPACRRGRVDGKPVAICRLKRVAADHKDDITGRIPKAPATKNGKKVALIGAGPSALTVANDLMPLGYQCTIFEKGPRPGGLMRINIPAFRLPEEVLDEEIGYIVNMGVTMKYDSPVTSLKSLVDSKEFDAVYVGTGAPKGKELDLPGRNETRPDLHRHRVARVDSLRPHQGSRQAGPDHRRRQHGDGLLPLGQAPGRDRREGDLAPDAQVLQGVAVGTRGRGRRAGRDSREPVAGPLHHRERQADRDGVRQVHLARRERQVHPGAGRPRHAAVRRGGARHRPGERVPLDRARHGPGVRQEVGHAGGRQDHVHVDAPRRVLRRRRGVWPGQHHLGGRARPPGGHLDSPVLPGPAGDRASGARHDAVQHQDGPARVVVQQQLRPGPAAEDEARRAAAPLLEDDDGGGRGLHGGADARRGGALPQLRRRDALHRLAVHRVRRLHRHLPDRLPDDCSGGRNRGRTARRTAGAGRPTSTSRCSTRRRSSRPGG